MLETDLKQKTSYVIHGVEEKMDFFVENANKIAEQMKDTMQAKVGEANIKVIGSGGAGNNMVSWL